MIRISRLIAVFLAAGSLLAGPTRPAFGAGETMPGLQGVVVESMDASRYTYMLLDTGAEQVWVAAGLTQVKAGDSVSVSGVLPMDNFHSKSLNRTFERIYFASSIQSGSGGARGAVLPADHPPVDGYGRMEDPAAMQLPAGHPDVSSPASSGAPPVAAMEPVAGGKRVAEVYGEKAALAGKQVSVRGKVIKVNDGILGRNWIHIKDGSGSAGSDDLTVTSTTHTAKLGDTVVAKGVLGVDRDFGGGYFYAVLLEDSILDVE